MRLIDADKLREWFETERPLSVQRMVEAIDAAPTIACSTCTHAPCDPHWCPSMSLYEPKEQP